MSDQEAIICEALSKIRNDIKELLFLEYIKVKDIYQQCNETESVIRKLYMFMEQQPKNNKKKTKKKKKKNNSKAKINRKRLIHSQDLDLLIDDVLNLISIAFISIGMKDNIFAQHSALITIERLLNTTAYNIEAIIPIKSKLAEIETILNNYDTKKIEDGSEYEYLENEGRELYYLIETKFKLCDERLTLIETSANFATPMSSIDNTLYHLLEYLLNFKTKIITLSSVSVYLFSKKMDKTSSETPEKEILIEEEIKSLKTDLENLKKEIIKIFKKNKPKSEDDEELIFSLFDECEIDLADFCANHFNYEELMDDTLKPIHIELLNMKYSMGILISNHRWKVQEKLVDLVSLQKSLQNIDSLRSYGVFCNDTGEPLKGQSTLSYLIGRCYSLTSKILELNEPISEVWFPLYNKVAAFRRILTNLKRSESFITTEDITMCRSIMMQLFSDKRSKTPYIMADDGSIPLGYGPISAMLDECCNTYQDLEINLTKDASEEGPILGRLIESLDIESSKTASKKTVSGKDK